MTSAQSLSRALVVGAFTVAFTAGFVVGCSEPSEEIHDAGTVEPEPDAGTGGNGDGGTGDGGTEFRCVIDDDCDIDKRCNDDTGECIPAEPCGDDVSIDPSTCPGEGSYCDTVTGLGCRCVPSELSPKKGFCKRRRPACSPCETDADCGDDPNWFETPLHNEGKCVDLEGNGNKVCLEVYRSQSKCSCGVAMQIDGAVYCAPTSGTCGEEGTMLCCSSDDECPPEYPACDSQSGRCIERCTYDYADERTVNCRADQACHVDPQYLDENSLTYAAGRCAAPCKDDQECKSYRSDFVCMAEADGLKRCRPPGCISDFECPVPEGSVYRGYCELSSGQCKTDSCRPGFDPFGNERADCIPGYKCENEVCVEQTCVEQGGAANACGYGEFCCGDDRDGDGTPDPCVNAVGTVVGQPGKCYTAPNPPWCRPCQSDDECVGGTPAHPSYKNKCVEGLCVYACTNLNQCPRGFACDDVSFTCNNDPSVCGDPNRCQNTGRVDQDGNPIMMCKCSEPGVVGAECPNAVCGASNWCVITRGCVPGANVCQ